MTNNPDTIAELTALFLRAQSLLHIVDDRAQLLPWDTLNTFSGLCGLIAQQPEDSPMACALVRLAAATAAALTTIVVVAEDNRQIIKEWESAKDEYEALTAQAD